ncbi:MAG: hypothetical protein CMG07_00605 [Candidatus Marinimicrobia bacterium]|nr:hypothetical protein [Candidatus Neomarinimicrobiota bacterium]|tara:strand:+ start:542 stop:1246 length:705 start_codon:yes stop_codon:yes gene_type:complete
MKKIKSISFILITWITTFSFGTLVIGLNWTDKRNRVFKFCELYWAKTIIYFSGINLNIHGKENIKNKRYIFCSNHKSALDIPIALSIINKPVVFLAKKQLFKIPIFSLILKSSGMIEVDRENKNKAKKSVNKAINKIKFSNNSLLVYPEGTRSYKEKIKPFKKGCFIIAVESGLPILPITIKGADKVLNKTTLLINPKHEVDIYFHKEIDTVTYNLENKDELLEKVRDQITSKL